MKLHQLNRDVPTLTKYPYLRQLNVCSVFYAFKIVEDANALLLS